MIEQSKEPASENGIDSGIDSNADETYVSRINWLVAAGRADLIDEIADECEGRRPRTPVETGTQLAVASLRRSHRRATSVAQSARAV